jgi:PKHD-type hydroxylase
LFDLDRSIQGVAAERGQGDAEVIRLTGVYHNLLRRWADS